MTSLVFALAASAAAAWPSPAQIALVEARRASFPRETLVSSVDWYQPLETVRGGRERALATRAPALSADALTAVRAYAKATDSHALLVWREGALEIEDYAPGFDTRSRFDTASMHKGVIALLVGAAIADGRLRAVDDPLGRYVKDLSPERSRMPLRSLLEMSSGLRTPDATTDPASPYWQSTFGDDLRASMARWPVAFDPYRAFAYANANTQYLGFAIEAATGRRYADYLSERLWRPLGNGDARVWLDRAGGTARTSGSLQATARDWLRIGRLILDRGRADGRQIVPSEWIAHMTAPSTANPNFGWQVWRGTPYLPARGYGLGVAATVRAVAPFAADDVVYLDGSGGQRLYIIPSRRLVIVRIGAPRRDWDDSRLPNLIVEGLP